MLLQYIALFCFECPQALGISRVDRWNNFYLSALAEYDKNWQECPHAKFLLTRLLRGATSESEVLSDRIMISTHTPLARRDTSSSVQRRWGGDFYSHASCEARPGAASFRKTCDRFLLTRLLRGATRRLRLRQVPFLLTRLLRGATKSKFRYRHQLKHFYSHAPCGARPLQENQGKILKHFYSHAPCGARPAESRRMASRRYFYSHAPCGARPTALQTTAMQTHFYSHAPCGARRQLLFFLPYISYFYSHAPCGARRGYLQKRYGSYTFLLTRPMRGATRNGYHRNNRRRFLLTRPMRGATITKRIG